MWCWVGVWLKYELIDWLHTMMIMIVNNCCDGCVGQELINDC